MPNQVFESLTIFSIAINAGIVYFGTTDLKDVLNLTTFDLLVVIIIAEHSVIALKVLIASLVSDIP